MVYSFATPFGSDWSGAEGAVRLPEPGSRRIWPSAIPAHAIFTPTPPPEVEGIFANDLHIGVRAGGIGHPTYRPNPS
ncbi:MAG: hypothetical protein H7338_02690 [Candidatus Sericytochromatia bacterium]|nr:hypothetical protein [Candidatus Sericytochromatia bacterium]